MNDQVSTVHSSGNYEMKGEDGKHSTDTGAALRVRHSEIELMPTEGSHGRGDTVVIEHTSQVL